MYMKKKYFFCLCLSAALIITHAYGWSALNIIRGNGVVTTQYRTVTSKYSNISVEGFFDLALVSGSQNKVVIEAEENLLPHILTEVKGGALTIKVEKGIQLRTTKKLQLTIPIKNINSISLRGSGDIVSKDTMRSNDISLSIAGSGDIEASVEAQNVSISISGSGTITVARKTNLLEANIFGSGNINAYKLESDTVVATISGSGDIETTAHNILKGTISGSGNIFYKENPNVQVRISGSGKVQSQN